MTQHNITSKWAIKSKYFLIISPKQTNIDITFRAETNIVSLLSGFYSSRVVSSGRKRRQCLFILSTSSCVASYLCSRMSGMGIECPLVLASQQQLGAVTSGSLKRLLGLRGRVLHRSSPDNPPPTRPTKFGTRTNPFSNLLSTLFPTENPVRTVYRTGEKGLMALFSQSALTPTQHWLGLQWGKIIIILNMAAHAFRASVPMEGVSEGFWPDETGWKVAFCCFSR